MVDSFTDGEGISISVKFMMFFKNGLPELTVVAASCTHLANKALEGDSLKELPPHQANL
jgi:hypothetical protein